MKRVLLICVVMLCSCSVMSEQELIAPVNTGEVPKVKSSLAAPMSREDSLRRVFKFQTDKEVIMQNYVNFAGGEFRLSISRDAAKALGIPDETYDKYVGQVRISNNQMTEGHVK